MAGRVLRFVWNDLFDRAKPGMWILYGLTALAIAVFVGVPSAGELKPVSGELRSYRIETRKSGEPRIVHFSLEESDLRYWTDEIDPDLVSGRLDGTRVDVHLYVETGRDGQPKRRGGEVKTYGWTVNGRQITSLQADLDAERGLVYGGMPVLALIMFGVAAVIAARTIK